jgi:flagellar hook-associated protein 3 FlgL
MRVTESYLRQIASDALVRDREKVATAGQALSSGIRVSKPSDDPVAWQEGVRTELRQLASTERGATMAQARDGLYATDQALGSLANIITRSIEIAVQASNDTLYGTNRPGLASEVAGLYENALSVGNMRGPNGMYLFGGSQNTTPPFSTTGVYAGDAVLRTIETSEAGTAVISMSGVRLTAAAGVDVFSSIQALQAALAADNRAQVSASLTDLQAALQQLSGARSDAGGLMNALERAQALASQMTDLLSMR